jgi:hypothetical protein
VVAHLSAEYQSRGLSFVSGFGEAGQGTWSFTSLNDSFLRVKILVGNTIALKILNQDMCHPPLVRARQARGVVVLLPAE